MSEPDDAAIVMRAGALGAGVGAVGGATWGSMSWPTVGTFFGAIGGTMAGIAAGLLTGLVVWVTSGPRRPRWVQRSSAAAATMVALVLFALFTPGFGPGPSAWTWVAIVAVSAVGAAAAAPCLVRGAYLTALGPWHGTRPVSYWAQQLLSWGAAVGGGVGAITGVTIGLRVYAPTAGFAALEGASFGAASGVVVALGVGGLVLVARVRARP